MAENFYIIENDLPSGPYTLEELKVKCISRDTRVWVEQKAAWVEAIDIPGLSLLFAPALYPESAAEKPEPEPEKSPKLSFGPRHFRLSACIIMAVILAVIALVFIGVKLLPTTSVIIK